VKSTPLDKVFLRIEAGPEVEDAEEVVVIGVADAAQEVVREVPRMGRGR
jgi:hypothetical protein